MDSIVLEIVTTMKEMNEIVIKTNALADRISQIIPETEFQLGSLVALERVSYINFHNIYRRFKDYHDELYQKMPEEYRKEVDDSLSMLPKIKLESFH